MNEDNEPLLQFKEPYAFFIPSSMEDLDFEYWTKVNPLNNIIILWQNLVILYRHQETLQYSGVSMPPWLRTR